MTNTNNTNTNTNKDFRGELHERLAAGFSGILVQTPEWFRVEQDCAAVAVGAGREFRRWTPTKGWTKNAKERGATGDFLEDLARTRDLAPKLLGVMHVAPEDLGNPVAQALLRELLREHTETEKTLVLVAPALELPPALEKEVTVLRYAFPDRDALETQLLKSCRDADIKPPDNGQRQKVVDASLGLTMTEAENAFALSAARHGEVRADVVLGEKKQVVSKSGLLEYYEYRGSLADVGGLDALKAWLRERSLGFTRQARDFGLPAPRGMLLLGVPGGGKSLTAKVVASEWQLPLLKFDFSKVLRSFVGESEQRMTAMLEQVGAMAPVVLWCDEVEKLFAGGTSGGGDNGVSRRLFGQFLTWLQERPEDRPVFVVMTANNISDLVNGAPEFLRKGRIDELFFVDIPTQEERVDILGIHLRKRGRSLPEESIAALAKRMEDFTGAEIEEAVKAGLWKAFADKGRALTEEDLLEAVQETKPLVVTMKTSIEVLRQGLLDGRWRSASKRQDPHGKGGRRIDRA